MLCLFIERLTALLPEEQKQHAQNVLPRRDFEVAYRVDCRNLCADFREDIEFRFSLGITSLVNRFLGSKNARTAFMGYSDSVSRLQPKTYVIYKIYNLKPFMFYKKPSF